MGKCGNGIVNKEASGFTLIELSIVLVIIGLIVGGILVGRDLIKAAEVRAQLSQIEKFRTAMNTFRAKFGALPGDMGMSATSQFGFTPGAGCGTTGYWGERDGDGIISSPMIYANVNQASGQSYGETALFWQDLSSQAGGNLIEGSFPNSGGAAISCSTAFDLNATAGATYIGDYLPAAKIGHSNFVAVSNTNSGITPFGTNIASNWFTVMLVTGVSSTSGSVTGNGNIPVIQAYNMDKKTDDGLPMSGTVEAFGITGLGLIGYNMAATDSPTTCFLGIGNMTYSISSLANYGSGGNCSISFKFQ